MKKIATLLVLLGGTLAAAADAGAQTPRTEVRVISNRGMIGVFTESVTVDGQTRLTIVDVVPGSPAAAAGLLRGDEIVRIDGESATYERLGMEREPGQKVRLRVRRDGSERDVEVVTIERTATLMPVRIPALPDSVLGQMAIIMESVRLRADSLAGVVVGHGDARFHVVTPRGDTVRFAPGENAAVIGASGIRTMRVGEDSVRVFHFGNDSVHVFRFGTDSIAARFAVPGRFEGLGEGIVYRRANVDSLRAHFEALRPTMDSAFVRFRGARGDSVFAWSVRPSDIAATAIFTGLNAVAGAHLSDLNPGLAEYFGVVDGVLVLDVPEGTPAARAGMRPGDVIVQVNRTPVRSTAEIRRAVGPPGTPTEIRVLRRGQPIDVTIGRQ